MDLTTVPAPSRHATEPVAIGSRLELFVDDLLIDRLQGTALRLHAPQSQPLACSPLRGAYLSVLLDGALYRAYYREYAASYAGESFDGNEGETTRYAESTDGREWTFPDLGIAEVDGSSHNNAILAGLAPFCHNFAPTVPLDGRPGSPFRFRALAGVHPGGGHAVPAADGLHAFGSVDGIHWEPLADGPVITHEDFAFDSQNVSFWSAAEGCYVCYFRTWASSAGRLRTVSRTTSPDYLHWSAPVPMDPNLPGEHLYVSGTHPYFRAPHLYLATPTRFHPDRGDSTDVLFMVTRAGSTRYARLFPEAFIRPGPDLERWGNRANYLACGIVPTGPGEISLYHCHSGVRYTLRTDGFISVHAGYAPGELRTQPLIFTGRELVLNYSSSAAGSLRVEVQDEGGRALPGFGLDAAEEIVGDHLERVVQWQGTPDLGAYAGRPVRLRFALRECDLYSLRFR
ncbi:MAG: hypothetical protein WDA75_09590 [Candidatus Latescibacterota bacterium]|jgi:hypothetical protein